MPGLAAAVKAVHAVAVDVGGHKLQVDSLSRCEWVLIQ